MHASLAPPPWTSRLLILLVAVGAGCAVGRPHAADDAAPVAATPVQIPLAQVEQPAPEAVMRAYGTAPGRAAELANVLQRVMRGGDDKPRVGNVTALDGDRVVVVAPRGIQEGVERLCDQMKEATVVARRSVQISYWLVRADPAETTDVSALPELAETLTEVAQKTGPAVYTLTERASLSSMLNARAQTKGTRAEFSQTATASEDVVVADVEIKLGTGAQLRGELRGELRSRVVLAPGQTAVIGQNGLTDGSDARMFYIVRAELVGPA